MKRIYVKVKPGAKEEQIKKIDETHYEVAVKEPPVEGRANRTLVRVLAEYIEVPQSQVLIVSGFTSRNKVIQIDE